MFKNSDAHRRMYTWLHLIAYEGYPNLIKDEITLLETRTKGPRCGKRKFQSMLDARSEGLGSVLHIVATQEDLSSTFELLLAKGANVNAKCRDIGTPLHSVARSGNLDAALLLLKNGADPNASCDIFGRVLDCALNWGSHISEDMISLLLRHGANANAQTQGINTAMRAFEYTDNGISISIMRQLLAHGADPNSAIEPGKTALHVAITQRCSKMVKVLLEGGADLNRRIGEYGNAVQTAGRTNDWRIMQALKPHGADVDPGDFSSSGPYSDPWIAKANMDEERSYR